jgi:2-polyprenyl-3-methyl-5-hydroxy-6-metoxy-1,4-benzoquinol methylase
MLSNQKICSLCGNNSVSRVISNSVFFPSYSENELLKDHENYFCNKCGLVAIMPQPTQQALTEIYSSIYRDSSFAISVSDDKTIDLPVQFPESAYSFARFENFISCASFMDEPLNESSFVIDLGGYQGMFLSAMRDAYGIDGMVADFNDKGIKFASEALGFTKSVVIDNVLNINAPKKADMVTMIHSFEHMTNPREVLDNIRSNLLNDNGYVYIEVPNLFGSPLNDPTHLFTFSMESLRYMLNISGFDVLNIFTNAIKDAPVGLGNDEVVICCLARKLGSKPDFIDLPAVKRISAINSSYRRHSRAAIKQQINLTFRHLIKLMYYVGVEFIVSKLPGGLSHNMKWLKSKIKFRAH